MGIPTFGIALWTPPGPPPRSLPRRLLRFVLPASALLALAAFAVYLAVYVLYDIDLPALRRAASPQPPTCPSVTMSAGKQPPMCSSWVGWSWCSLRRHPRAGLPLLRSTTQRFGRRSCAGRRATHALIMFVPILRHFFGMRGIGLLDYAIVLAVIVIWTLLLRWIWQQRLFDRFFGYSDSGETNS